MPPRGAPPLVTGVSPKEGPPGTRITIRGENLGNDIKDLIALKICGVDCLLYAEWKSSSKIIGRTGSGKGKGDIIVITKSGGVGSCTVGFRGYFIQYGPLQESAVWIDESQTVLSNYGRTGRPTSSSTIRDDEDPLGISDEGNEKKFSEEDLFELFPDASGNMSLENFSSAWYLLENHHGTGFDDLQAGLAHMKRRAAERSEGPIAFVKSNIVAIMDCLDSLQKMYEKFVGDDTRGDTMNSYAVLLMQAKSCADGLFQDVLGRKDKADSTRNALSVLQRFKFLFYLPVAIERNIQKGDYNLVINDYVRMKALFGDTQVQIFRKFYLEVENRLINFRLMLRRKLLQLPNTLEDQKKLIRYLVNLESGEDAAWECLENQQKWINQQLLDCKDEHLSEDSIQVEPVTSPKWKAGRPVLSTPIKNQSFSSMPSPDVNSLKFKTPQKILFIEDLTEIMTDCFPDFWKLGQTYLSGEFQMKEVGEKTSKVDPNRLTLFKQKVAETVGLYTQLIRAAYLPESIKHLTDKKRQKYGFWQQGADVVPGSWLPHCVRCIRSSGTSLLNLDLPNEVSLLIQELTFDMRTSCMFILLKQAICDVNALSGSESWNVEMDDHFGGTTQLPALFENIVNETIQHLHEVVVQVKTGETEIFNQRTNQKEATSLCAQLLRTFADCLETLAFEERSEKDLSESSREEDRSSIVHSSSKKLMIMLSNCNYTIGHVIPRLIENFSKYGYVEMNKVLKEAEETYTSLDAKLFEAYVEEKLNPLVGVIEYQMYRGKFEWNKCSRPTGVHNYLKETILALIEIYAEVFTISPSFITRVMTKVIEGTVEEICRLIICNPDFNRHGALQARLELHALQDGLQAYMSDDAKATIAEAFDHIPKFQQEDKRVLEEMLNKFKSQMHFQLMCFRKAAAVTSEL